jgi:hypothetical protein
MNLSEFFDLDTVTLPVGGFEEKTETFDRFLRTRFDKYIALVTELDDGEHPKICSKVKSSLGSTELLCNQIISALSHYLRGYPSKAYWEIEQSLQSMDIGNLTTSMSGGVVGGPPKAIAGPVGLRQGAELLDSSLHPPLYRMRENKGATAASGELSGKALFHVPFEDRRLVRNQRYSIAGLPCLYLGSSTWACWEELGRPDLDGVFVSLFRFIQDTSVLDFQFPPINAWNVFRASRQESKIAATEFSARYGDSFIESYISLWPLIAACSVKTASGDGSFYPQYIVPQMLLQWVCDERKVDGIRYFSTRTPRGGYPYYNCAFPARNITHHGRCSYLRERFKLTDPISWSILREIDIRSFIDAGPSNWGTFIPVSKDIQFGYAQTGFYIAEQTLKYLEEKYPNASKQVEP